MLRWLPPASLERVFILFPDPWPKKRHVKRRLMSRNLLDLLARVMAPGAELRVATDIGDYAGTILLAACGHPAFAWQAEGPPDWRERRARLARRPATRPRRAGKGGAATFSGFSSGGLSRHNSLASDVMIP